MERTRDGSSFTTRRVRGIQSGEPIFAMSASFQVAESGFEHQIPVPFWPPPEQLEDDTVVAQRLMGRDPNVMPRTTRSRPFESRSVYPVGMPAPEAPIKPAWYRLRSSIDGEPILHACLLAYCSDMGLMSTSLVPHLASTPRSHIIGASLDHAMWFHRLLKVDNWFLYDRDSPSASASWGFNRGSFYDREGRLAASVAQESLIRVRRDMD